MTERLDYYDAYQQQFDARVVAIEERNGTPVVILDGSAEGTAWGAALMAKYRAAALAGRSRPWPDFLAAHASGTPTRFTPRPAAVAALAKGLARHRQLVGLHAQLAGLSGG